MKHMGQGDFPSSFDSLQSAYDEHVDCWGRWAKAALFLGEYRSGLAEIAEVGRDNFQKYFA